MVVYLPIFFRIRNLYDAVYLPARFLCNVRNFIIASDICFVKYFCPSLANILFIRHFDYLLPLEACRFFMYDRTYQIYLPEVITLMKLFDYDSNFMRFVILLSHLTLLNIIWTLCCLPVVTAGAATAAQHYSALKLSQEDTHVFRNFKDGFKQHWKRSSLFWIVVLILSAAFGMGIYILTTAVVPGKDILITVSTLAFLTMVLILLWFFPVMVHFTGSFKEILFNSFVFTFMYAPVTLIAAALYVIAGLLCIRYRIAAGLFLVFGQSLIVYANLALFHTVFKKYKTSGT